MSSRPTQRFQLFYGFVSYIGLLQYGYSWINYTVNARNVAAPCAWNAKHYYKETHYYNDDSRDNMLHSSDSTTVGYLHTRPTFLMITELVGS